MPQCCATTVTALAAVRLFFQQSCEAGASVVQMKGPGAAEVPCPAAPGPCDATMGTPRNSHCPLNAELLSTASALQLFLTCCSQDQQVDTVIKT